MIARPRLSGFFSTGAADLSAEIGSGRTPRNGPGVDRDRRGRQAAVGDHLRQQPAGRVAHDRGLPVERADHLGGVVGDLLSVFFAKTSGFARASSTVSGSSGQSGVTAA